MSQTFKSRNDFAHLKESVTTYASDYTTNKKVQLSVCNRLKDFRCKKRMTQGSYLLLQKGLLEKNKGYVSDTSQNLIRDLYYPKTLSNIHVVGSVGAQTGTYQVEYGYPTTINICNTPFYAYYAIDPNGYLFTNSCDIITNP